MRIHALIKQVPESGAVRMDDATGTMVRADVEAIVNPLDLYAIETALALREHAGGSVTALSMGPPMAESALREVLAMGIDAGVLVSDRAFAGSDTWATAAVLAAAVKKLGLPDLILCGERATDGDTGQVGSGLAALLDLPVVTYVARIEEVAEDMLLVRRLVEHGYERLDVKLPAVLTVVKEIGAPRLPTLRGKQRARRAAIPTWGLPDLEATAEQVGLRGSPTRVVKIFRPKIARAGELLDAASDEAVDTATTRVVEFLTERNLL